MDKAVGDTRGRVGIRTWAVWALLSAAAYAMVAYVAIETSTPLFSFLSVQSPVWMQFVRMIAAPAVGIAALVLPIAALITLLLRRFHVTVLVGIAACIALLAAYMGLEKYWMAHPVTGFEADWSAAPDPGPDAAPQ